jgi:hypothetical protein
MAYSKAKLKSSGDKASSCFRPLSMVRSCGINVQFYGILKNPLNYFSKDKLTPKGQIHHIIREFILLYSSSSLRVLAKAFSDSFSSASSMVFLGLNFLCVCVL